MGGTSFAYGFSTIFATNKTRTVFVESCSAFVAKHGFDGINIDWHYPKDDRENNDKKNFVTILKLLRNEFSKQKGNKELTITIPEKPFDANGFDIPNLDNLVDFYCLTSYNYHTTDERSVHHHAPLFKNERHQACNDDLQLTINDTVTMYIKWNITREKLIVGIPLYGSCYKLEDGKNNMTGSASSGPCWRGKWPVLPPYHTICEQLKQNISIQSHDATCNEGPYAIENDGTFTTWTSFDDAFIVKQKSYYVSGYKLGGVSFWTVQDDDYNGQCGKGIFPLINAATNVLTSKITAYKSNEIIAHCHQNKEIEQRGSEDANLPMNLQNHSVSEATITHHLHDNEYTIYNPYRLRSHNTWIAIWGIINFFVGVIGNSMTIVAIPFAVYKKRYGLDKAWYDSTIFIINLAVSDLMYCVLGLPHEIMLHLGIGWPFTGSFGDFSCKLFNVIAPIFAYDSWFALALIAFTRAFHVVKPFAWKNFCTKRNVAILIIASKLFNVVLCIPRLLPDGKKFIKNEYAGACQHVPKDLLSIGTSSSKDKPIWNKINLQMMPHYTAFFITMVVIVVSYSMIWNHVKSSKRKINSLKKGDKAFAEKNDQNQMRLTVTFFIICALFFVCALPLTLIEIIGGKIGYNMIISLYWMQYCINFVVYAARRDKFLQAYLDILMVCGCARVVFWSKRNIKFVENYRSKISKQLSRSRSKVTHNENSDDIIWQYPSSEHSKSKDMTLKSVEKMKKDPNNEKKKLRNLKKKKDNRRIKNILLFILCSFILIMFVMMEVLKTKPKNLLILGGYTSKGRSNVCLGWLDNVTIIDLEKAKLCSEGPVQFTSKLKTHVDSLESLPNRLTDATGQNFENYPVICGGKDDNWKTLKSCYKMITRDQWSNFANMTIERSKLASAVNTHGLFVLGGQDGSGQFNGDLELLPNLTSTKFERKSSVLNNSIGISGACMVSLDDDTLLVVGGFHSGYIVTNQTLKYHIKNDKWTIAKPLKEARAHHACGLIKDENNEKTMVIAVGGSIENGSSTKSVEIYDPENDSWKNGKSFPTTIMYSQLVEDDIKGGILLIGGRTSTPKGFIKRSPDIYHLSNAFKEWRKLGQTIELGRESHVALMLPDTIDQCSN